MTPSNAASAGLYSRADDPQDWSERQRPPLDAEATRKLIGWLESEHHPRILATAGGEVAWMSAAACALPHTSFPFATSASARAGAGPRIDPALLRLLVRLDDQPKCIVPKSPCPWLLWARRLGGDERPFLAITLRRRGERLQLKAFAEANRLTPAEARVIAMIVEGADSSAIADALHISIETLRTHVKHAYRKLGVSSRGELFARALDFVQP